MKKAILQMADAGPVESTWLMLRSVGYKVYLPDKRLREELKRIGCDTVLSPRDLTNDMGYDPVSFPEAGIADMDSCDLYCDVKAHRCYDKVVSRWPNLKNKVLWTRINGGAKEHVIRSDGFDCGDEVNPPCPVLTPNQWYKHPREDRFYACWPPFYRIGDYRPDLRKPVAPPICLIHNINGWGYRDLVPEMLNLGIRCHGTGAPHGLLQHAQVPGMLSKALCLVHLKSSDAPGYSLLEALAAACPVVCTRRLIWRCRMEELLIPGETCLVFDRETHEGLSPEDVQSCTAEVAQHLERLKDPAENRRIGGNGYNRLREIMWNPDKVEDRISLAQFMERNFP